MAANAAGEARLVGRHVAGALACFGEVEILSAGAPGEARTEGVIRVLPFEARRDEPARRGIVHTALFGLPEMPGHEGCDCHRTLAERSAADAPAILQREALRLDGSDSPALFEHLARGGYDRVVFVDAHVASTCLGVEAVPEEIPVVVVPLLTAGPRLRLGLMRRVFERAGRVLVLSGWEERLVRERFGHRDVRNVGMVLRVNRLAAHTDPPGFEERPYVVVDGASVLRSDSEKLIEAATLFAAESPDARLCVVGGEGVALAEASPFVVAHGITSRVDLWRWMSRAHAVLDPSRGRPLGREVLEAMLLGAPVVVRADSGAVQEHVEEGRGGLWYRSVEELVACLGALFDPAVRGPLGASGRAWVEQRFGHRDGFVARVREAVGI